MEVHEHSYKEHLTHSGEAMSKFKAKSDNWEEREQYKHNYSSVRHN